MESIMKADVFFVVTTAAVIVLSLALLIILVYVIKFLRDITYISKRVKEESDEIIDDVKTLRTSIKNEGFKMRYFSHFIKAIFSKRKKAKERGE